MLRTYHKEFLGFHNRCDEMLLRAHPTVEFGAGQHEWIDFPSYALLNARQQRGDSAQSDLADDHEVNVAVCLVGAGGHGSENESTADTLAIQGFLQDTGQTGCLENDLPYVREQGVPFVGGVDYAVAILAARDQVQFDQFLDILAHRSDSESGLPLEFPKVRLPSAEPEKNPEDLGSHT